MSSPPLPSADLAERLAWLAGEVRAEKADAGMIVALFMEVFARLLSRLSGLVAGIEAGTLSRPEPRPTTASTTAAATVAPGLLPRVLGWFGGLLPSGSGPVEVEMRPDASNTLLGRQRRKGTEMPATTVMRGLAPRIDAFAEAPAIEACIRGTSPRMTMVFPFVRAAPVWVVARLATWRRLPASTAGPFFQNAELHDCPSRSISLRYQNVLAWR